MTTYSIPRSSPAASIARRRTRHSDWPALAQRLVEEFPDATIADVVREVRDARDATERMGLDGPEAVDVGEPIVRNRLKIVTGRGVDAARLDPQHHQRS